MALNPTDVRSPIRKQRIRVPRQHNTALHIPPLVNLKQQVARNRELVADQQGVELCVSFLPGGRALTVGDQQVAARAELVEIAQAYSSQYLKADVPKAPESSTIVMSGHQPELYHPGVWYKNFVLSKLARCVGARAINLVIDSDLAGPATIRCPDLRPTEAQIDTIPIDKGSPGIPHELRPINDWGFFRALPDRIGNLGRERVLSRLDGLIVDRLWPEVLEAAKALGTEESPGMLGPALAAGRHRFEQQLGLETIEVPLSRIAGTRAFATFVAAVLDRASEFRDIYNAAIDQYRQAHRIRSRQHPVPELESVDGWLEVPFWIYQSDAKHRRRLFAQLTPSEIVLSDRDRCTVTISKEQFVADFQALPRSGIFVRPRALTTTMFSRLMLSDIFLHGIGGAKYDLLTDAICERFFGYRLPRYATLSATMMLPTQETVISKTDITERQRQRRELQYHPEKFIDLASHGSEIQELVERKRRWTSASFQQVRSQEKHDSIAAINRELRVHLVDHDQILQQQIANLKSGWQRSQIVGSREYSFCLFEMHLVDGLKRLADDLT